MLSHSSRKFSPRMPLDDDSHTRDLTHAWLKLTGIPLLLLVAAACSLGIDMPVAKYSKYGVYPKIVGEILNHAEPFGHAFGATVVIVAIALLDPRMRWRLGSSMARAKSEPSSRRRRKTCR